jgi:hypothetical protein
MIWLIAGFAALAAAFLLLTAFARADAAAVKKAVVWGGAGLGVLLALFLLLTGRGGMAISALIFFGPALWRWWQGWRAKQVFQGDARDGETAVDTATLQMRLDLATGEMRGRVIRGVFAGRDLAELPQPRLLELLEDCRAEDPESVPLLEAWLDRVAPDWRNPAEAPLDRRAALELLGLHDAATEEEIRAAHRRRMREAHPDAGGDAALAARLNAARDLLLGD